MLIDKSHIPLVAVASMNDTHFEEVDLLNRLHDAIVQRASAAANAAPLSALVDEFEAHVVAHFAAEEQLMLETGFPAYPVHKGEHDRVLGVLRGLLHVYRTAGDISPLADHLANAFPVWVRNHIATMDTMTAYFIARATSAAGQPAFGTTGRR